MQRAIHLAILAMVSLCSILSAQTTASDDFERSALGPNWMISFPASGNQVQIIGNSDLGMVAGPQGFFLANWAGAAFGPDQYCEAVIPLDAPPNWAHQVYVRRRSDDAARYGFGFDNDSTQTLYYKKWYFKYDGVAGPQTRMFGVVDKEPQAPRPGDTLRVEIIGYTLYGYWNGRLMATATDTASNRIANGVPGLAARVANGNQAITQSVRIWEMWRGGTLAVTAIRPPIRMRTSNQPQSPWLNGIDVRGRAFVRKSIPSRLRDGSGK